VSQGVLTPFSSCAPQNSFSMLPLLVSYLGEGCFGASLSFFTFPPPYLLLFLFLASTASFLPATASIGLFFLAPPPPQVLRVSLMDPPPLLLSRFLTFASINRYFLAIGDSRFFSNPLPHLFGPLQSGSGCFFSMGLAWAFENLPRSKSTLFFPVPSTHFYRFYPTKITLQKADVGNIFQ